MADRMQPLDAIVAGGPHHALVGRPGGVTHLYAGPLTRTGIVPKGNVPVCGARTRRLYDRSSFLVRGDLLVCARCSARLPSGLPPARAEHLSPVLSSMADDRRRYQHLTPVDIYLSVRFAVTEAELDECSLALQLCFTREQQNGTYMSPTGREFSNLPKLVDDQRARIRPRPPTALNPVRDGYDSGYADAVRQFHRVPRHKRQTIRLRTA